MADLHPLYQVLSPRWKFLRASYLGGSEWYGQGETYEIGPFVIQRAVANETTLRTDTYSLRESNRLWRHEREKDARYSRRMRASVYENLFRPFVDTQAATIAKACTKCELPATIKYLETDTDRWGQDLAMARFRRIAWAHVYRHVFTLLDKPNAPAQPSLAHERAAGIRTYFQLLSPLDLLDWNWDSESMQFRWALIREHKALDREDPTLRKSGAVDSAPQWTKLLRPGNYVRFRDGKEYESGPAPDFVPIAVQFGLGCDPEQAEPIGMELNGDVADLAELRFNKQSWLADQEMGQCFNQVMIKHPDMQISDEQDRALGTHNYIAAEAMQFVAPDVAPMQHLLASQDHDAATMRQMMGIETKGETSQAAKSGVALQLEQQNMSRLFAGYSTAAESGERQLLRMAAMLEGANADEVRLEYASDFSEMDLAGRYSQIVLAIEKGGFTGAAKAALQKALFAATMPEMEQSERDEIFADIDEGAATLASQPFDGKQFGALKEPSIEGVSGETESWQSR